MTDTRDQLRGLAAQFTNPTASEQPQEPPEAAQERPQRPEATPQPSNKAKTSLNLPESLAARLRAWRDDTGRSHGDAIVSALIEELPALRQQLAGAAERIELGLAPLGAGHEGDRELVTFWATPAALERLDDAAASLAMTRSALIAALLDLHLP